MTPEGRPRAAVAALALAGYLAAAPFAPWSTSRVVEVSTQQSADGSSSSGVFAAWTEQERGLEVSLAAAVACFAVAVLLGLFAASRLWRARRRPGLRTVAVFVAGVVIAASPWIAWVTLDGRSWTDWDVGNAWLTDPFTAWWLLGGGAAVAAGAAFADRRLMALLPAAVGIGVAIAWDGLPEPLAPFDDLVATGPGPYVATAGVGLAVLALLVPGVRRGP